jgi:hypothetical protein
MNQTTEDNMDWVRLKKMCDVDTIEGAIAMIVRNRVDITGIGGLTTYNAIKATKEAIEYFETRKQEEKRKPDSNGVLPLTESELKEFAIINKTTPNVTLYLSGGQIYCKYNGDFDFSVYRYKTILWLAERFNLGGE